MSLTAAETRAVVIKPIVAITTIVLLIVVLRRPDQFLDPSVWAEDGSQTIPDFLHHGWATILMPLNGYMLLPTRLIGALSLSINAANYGAVSYALTLVFTAAFCLAFLSSDLLFAAPAAALLAIFLVPCGPETLGTSLYSFWIGGLFCLIPALWQMNDSNLGKRCAYTIIGGLSGPMIVAAAPIYLFRYLKNRTRHDLGFLLVAGALAATQTIEIISRSADVSNNMTVPGISSIPYILQKYFSLFFTSRIVGSGYVAAHAVIGAFFMAFLAVLFLNAIRNSNYAILFSGFLFAALTSMSILRCPPEIGNPMNAGARYFFYPYIMIAWTLIEAAASTKSKYIVVASVVLLALALRITLSHGYFAYRHDPLNWIEQIRSCAETGSSVHTHNGGHTDTFFPTGLTQKECQEYLSL